MRLSFSIARWSAVTVALCGVLVLAGCPKQDDFPAALNVTAPATPTNFVITNPSGTTYTFEWTAVSGPVDHYRLYLLGNGLGPDELLAETTLTSITPPAFGFSAEGLQFAGSAVSDEGVEGFRAVATAP